MAACHIPPSSPSKPALRDELPLSHNFDQEPLKQELRPAQEWWRELQDPQLQALIETALANAPDLAQAQARVDIALQNVNRTRAEQGVKIDARAQANRTRLSKNLGLLGGGSSSQNTASTPTGSSAQAQSNAAPSVTSIGLVGLQFQYDFDWWGRRRAAVNAAVDQAHASEADRFAARLVLENAIADNYFGWLIDNQRQRIAEQLIAAAENSLYIAQRRHSAGLSASDDIDAVRTQLADARVQATALSTSAQLHVMQIAALVGVAPEQLPDLQPRTLPQINIPLSNDMRIALLGRRPDIVASRWRVEAAAQDVEAARTAFLPDISISALTFFVSDDFKKLFDSDSLLWSVGPALTLPIFDGGRLRARYGVSKAQLNGAIADYNDIVVRAAQDVATDALTLQQIETQRGQQQIAVEANARRLANTDARARQGLIDKREKNQAQAQLLESQDTALQFDQKKISTQLALIKALGGGYADAQATRLEQQSQSQTQRDQMPKTLDARR